MLLIFLRRIILLLKTNTAGQMKRHQTSENIEKNRALQQTASWMESTETSAAQSDIRSTCLREHFKLKEAVQKQTASDASKKDQ